MQPAANGAGAGAARQGTAGAVTAPAAAETPSWIRDFIGAQQVATVEFRGSLAEQRQAVRKPLMLVVLTWIGFTWFGLSVSVPAAVTAVAAVIALGALANGYRQDPSVQAQWLEQERLREVEVQTRAAQRRLQRLQRKLNRAEHKITKRRARLEESRRRSKEEEQAALAKHDGRLQNALADAQRSRDALRQAGVERVRKLEARHAERIAELDQEVAGLHQKTEDALHQALVERQQQFVQNYMKRQTIESAVIAGIGPNVKEALRKHGIVRAMDIDPQRLAQVEGIGEARLRVLLEWRRKAEHLAAQTAPQNLSLLDETLIRGRLLKRRLELEQEKAKLQGKLAKEVAEAQQRNAAQLKTADEEPQKLRAAAAQRRDEIRARFQQARKQVQADLAELDKQAVATQGALDSEADAVQQELAMLNAQRAAITASLRRYEGLQFGAYVRRVVTGE